MAVTDDLRTPVTSATLRIVERAFAGIVGGLDPHAVLLRDVTDVWSAFDRIERMASSAKVLLAARVDEAGTWKRAGARSAAEHLAKLGGTSTSEARRSLETSKQLAQLPSVADAMRAGALSDTQAGAIADAGFANPGAVDRLLDVASATNVTELREECLRTKVAADPDRDTTHRRIHAERCLRSYTDGEGARNLVVRGMPERVARIERALEPIIDDLFAQARADGRREPRAAYAFDALVILADREGTEHTRSVATKPTKRKRRAKPRYLSLAHLSVEAMTRGAIEGEETCEIVGVGPVPVRIARELLGESILHLVLTKGVDVVNVTHLGRSATAAQRIAVLWSKPKCANEACSSTFVQLDHREPWAEKQETKLENIDPLCPHDHDLKTHQRWSLVEGTGRRAFVGPDDPRHPRNKPPPNPD